MQPGLADPCCESQNTVIDPSSAQPDHEHDLLATQDMPKAELPASIMPPPGQVAAITLIILGIIGIAWLMIELTQFLLLVFASLVLAAVFSSLARRVCRLTGMKRGPALAIAVFLLLAIFSGAFTLFGSQIAREFEPS